jgi:hypothetical protein
MATITITYSPPEVDPSTWVFETDSWTFGETVDIEREYGGTRREFFADVSAGSDTARQILVWMVRRRTELKLTLEDLNDMLPSYLGFVTSEAPELESTDDPKDPADPADVQE